MEMNKKVVLIGIFTIILSIIISVSYFQLWGTDINVPLTGYRSDSIGVLLEAANYCRGGNLFNNIIYNAPNINNNVFLGGISDSSVPMNLIKPLSSKKEVLFIILIFHQFQQLVFLILL